VSLKAAEDEPRYTSRAGISKEIKLLTKEMHAAAAELAFEEAAGLRDRIKHLREAELGLADFS